MGAAGGGSKNRGAAIETYQRGHNPCGDKETTTAATAGRETRSSFRKKKEKHGLALVAPHTIPSLRRRNDARNMARESRIAAPGDPRRRRNPGAEHPRRKRTPKQERRGKKKGSESIRRNASAGVTSIRWHV